MLHIPIDQAEQLIETHFVYIFSMKLLLSNYYVSGSRLGTKKDKIDKLMFLIVNNKISYIG